jgi:hypothetical protein
MQSKHVSKLATLTPFQMGVGDNTAAVVLLRHIAATNKSFFRQHGLRAQKLGTNFRPTQTESRFLRVSLRSRKNESGVRARDSRNNHENVDAAVTT